MAFTGYYLPGYKSGGPVKSIANMVRQLGSDFDFKVVTRDHDQGEVQHHPGIVPGQWNQVGQAQVYYLQGGATDLQTIRALIASTKPDLLYLNSFFDPRFTLKPLVAAWLGSQKPLPILLAPRGEFSEGAMKLRAWKKVPYSFFARSLHLAGRVHWQASTELERKDILRVMRGDENTCNISVAPDLVEPPEVDAILSTEADVAFKDDELRICFLSRISEMKNLDFALQVLSQVKAKVRLSIYGPVASEDYWATCSKLMERLPQNVNAKYCGSVPSHMVRGTISQHQLFFVPSRGENFGHVFIESLSVGVPILVSDQTPWRGLAERKLGWDFPLTSTDEFSNAIDNFAGLPESERVEMSKSCLQFSRRMAEDPAGVDLNRAMFRRAMSHKPVSRAG